MRIRQLPLVLSSLFALVACAALTSRASAQAERYPRDLAISRMLPASAGDRMFGVQSPYIGGELAFHGMVLVDYARMPLAIRRDDDGSLVGAVVRDQLFLHASATVALWSRVQVSVDMPFALFQSGDTFMSHGWTFTPPSAAVGDLQLGMRIRLFGDFDDVFQVAVGGYAWLPTGSEDEFVSDGRVRGLPQLIVGGRASRFVWSLAGGPELRRPQTFLEVGQGPRVNIGAGFGLLLGQERRLQIGPEILTSFVLYSAIDGVDPKETTNIEVLLDARYRFAGFMEAGVGVGPGLTQGVGTPSVRALGMLAFTPEQKREAPPPPDKDSDGIVDAQDACPDVKGITSADPKKHGCPPPPPDGDEDGIFDSADACPAIKGVVNEDPKKNGCPPDRDADEIADVEDACPDVKGVPDPDPAKHGCPPDKDADSVADAEDACVDIPGIKTADPATNGCPGDTDKDTIRDDKDACPLEKGKPDPDATKNGCPQSVRVTESEIIILQQVQFETGRATIKKVSDPLLDEVAEVLKEHPEILKLEVQGHTDDKGQPKFNEKLSQDRATSVMSALIKRGLDKGRLLAKGYGQSAPIADNKTDAGRQQNRRVQFKIIEKTPKPSGGQPPASPPTTGGGSGG